MDAEPAGIRNDVGRRLLAIGLDGGDIDVIASRAAQLPTLTALLDKGRLMRTEAPKALSGSVWPTFYSGRDPGHHGMYQHLVWDADRMGLRRIAPEWCDYRPFWADLAAAGHRVTVLDVPYSFADGPADRSTVVTDWGTHGQTWPIASNRPEILKLVKQFGASGIGRETPVAKSPRRLAHEQRRLEQSAARKGELIRRLMAETDWDLFLTVFGETHRAGHLFYSDEDDPRRNSPAKASPMLSVYQAVDLALAGILETADPWTDILIFSVHGMMRNPAQEHLVRPFMNRFNDWFLLERAGLPETGRKTGGLVGFLRRRVPGQLQIAAGDLAPDFIRQWIVEREMVGGIDWSRTPGFALRTDIRTELRLNLKGRERLGVLKPGSDLHRIYVEDLTQAFLDLTDTETGERLVDEVVDLHAAFPGDRADRLPDFAVTWRPAPAASHVHTPLLGGFDVTRPGGRGGDHTDDGFALLLRAKEGRAPPPPRTTADFARYIGALLPNGPAG